MFTGGLVLGLHVDLWDRLGRMWMVLAGLRGHLYLTVFAEHRMLEVTECHQNYSHVVKRSSQETVLDKVVNAEPR